MSNVSTVKQLLADIGEERAKGVRQGRMVGGVVLLLFILALGHAWWRVSHFDTAALAEAMEREASTRVWPLVSHELDSIAADAVPALSAALQKEAGNILPKVNDKLAGESVLFQQHVHEKMNSSLDAHFKRAAAAHSEELKARFPQFAADSARYDALIASLQSAAQAWAMNQLDTTFAKHIVVLQSINESVTRLAAEAAANPEKSGERDMDEVLTLFLEIMNARLEGKE
jgi:hypothetical protein